VRRRKGREEKRRGEEEKGRKEEGGRGERGREEGRGGNGVAIGLFPKIPKILSTHYFPSVAQPPRAAATVLIVPEVGVRSVTYPRLEFSG
jgi:hypothetical protein